MHSELTRLQQAFSLRLCWEILTLLLLPWQVKMHTVSYIHFFYLGLCLLTLTSSAAAGPETLCGAELVDALQFVCGDRGFYFSKSTLSFIQLLALPCNTLKFATALQA